MAPGQPRPPRQQPHTRSRHRHSPGLARPALLSTTPPLLLLLLLPLVTAQLAGAARSLWPLAHGRRSLAEQPGPAQADSGPAAAPPSPETYLHCSGQTPQTRSCLAHNLYYHIPAQSFVAVGYASSAATGSQPPHSAADFALEHYNITLLEPNAGPAPDPSKTLEQPGLNVFWRFINGGAGYSIGHALVHELFPLFHTLDNLLAGRVPRAFNLVTLHGQGVPQVVYHVTPAIHDRHVSWPDLCNRATDAGKEWIRLEAATLGDNGHSGLAQNIHYQRHPGPNMFNSEGWVRFRAWMLRSAGLDPDAAPTAPLVVLNDKVMPDGTLEPRRRIHNIQEVAEHLQKSLPDAKVERVAFMSLSWRHQLEILVRTTLFITTEGSSGFRYVFLPPGASVILLSHPDNMTEGAAVVGDFPQWHEVDKYFPLIHLYFLKYSVNVDHTEQYVVMAVTDDGRQVERKHQLYNAHIIVQLERITPMAQEAVRLFLLHRRIHSSYHALAGLA